MIARSALPFNLRNLFDRAGLASLLAVTLLRERSPQAQMESEPATAFE